MPERNRHTNQEAPETPFWTHDEPLGVEIDFGGRPRAIHLQAHLGDEPYRHRRHAPVPHEVVPIEHRTGTRTYVLARPYIPEPDIMLTIGVFPDTRRDGAIGQVLASFVEGIRRREIGKAQAWFYKEDRTLILWEVLLNRGCGERATDDPSLRAVWDGFERFLLRQFPQTEHIATPSWEPLYGRDEWQSFLRARGYGEINVLAFGKRVASAQHKEHAVEEATSD